MAPSKEGSKRPDVVVAGLGGASTEDVVEVFGGYGVQVRLWELVQDQAQRFDGARAESGVAFFVEERCNGIGDGGGGRRGGAAVVGADGVEQGDVVGEFVEGELGVAVFVGCEGRARSQRGEL